MQRGLFKGMPGGQKTVNDTFAFDNDATNAGDYGKMDLAERSGIQKNKKRRANPDASAQGGCCTNQCSLF